MSELPNNPLLTFGGPRPISFSYKNYKGEIRRRKAIIVGVYWGSNKWHQEEQWLALGNDLEKDAIRTYALKDIRDIRPLDPKTREILDARP